MPNEPKTDSRGRFAEIEDEFLMPFIVAMKDTLDNKQIPTENRLAYPYSFEEEPDA